MEFFIRNQSKGQQITFLIEKLLTGKSFHDFLETVSDSCSAWSN